MKLALYPTYPQLQKAIIIFIFYFVFYFYLFQVPYFVVVCF